ncbi:hypothetical protein KCU91_g15951, partial [Aureobasidium melanogenum]
MPPKGSKKAAAAPPATPKADSGDEAAVATPSTVKKTPRKPRAPPKPFSKLSTALSGAAPVDVTYENETVQSKILAKEAQVSAIHPLSLMAPLSTPTPLPPCCWCLFRFALVVPLSPFGIGKAADGAWA